MVSIKRPAIDKILPTGPNRTALNLTEIRDGQQSKHGGMMRREERFTLAPIINQYYAAGGNGDGVTEYHGAAEVAGGTRTASALKLGENPYQDVRDLKEVMPNTPFMALIRSAAGNGMEEAAPDILEQHIHLYHEAGIDVFRNFHALNDPRAHKAVYDAVRKVGGHFQAAYSMAVWKDDPTIYNPKMVVTFFKKLKALGIKPDSYVLKDPSGVLTPEMAKFITRDVKAAQARGELEKDIAFGIHTHNQGGWAHEVGINAVKEHANFFDAGADAGGYGAQPPAVKLFKEISFINPSALAIEDAKKPAALKALKDIDEKSAEFLKIKVPATDAEKKHPGFKNTIDSDGNRLLYIPDIRQPDPDPAVIEHGFAGGASAMAREEILRSGYPLKETMARIIPLMPSVSEDLGKVCGVTPVQDYKFRRAFAIVQMEDAAIKEAGEKGLKGEDRERYIKDQIKTKSRKDLYPYQCGFARILTGEMGPTKEPVNEEMARQALFERAANKLAKFDPKYYPQAPKDRKTPEEKSNEKALRIDSDLRKLTDYMWDLAEPVRALQRRDEVKERLGELKDIQHGSDEELRQYMNKELAIAEKPDLKQTIATLEQEKERLDAELTKKLAAKLIEFGVIGIDISQFKGEDDAERYKNMYESIQRPEFKKETLDFDASPQNHPLYKLYIDIKRKNSELLDVITPEKGIKLIRSSSLTTVCMGDVIPPGLDQAKAFLADLHKKGEYLYPINSREQREDEVLIGMIQDPRAENQDKRHDIPRKFFRDRDGLYTAAERAAMTGHVTKLSKELKEAGLHVSIPTPPGADVSAVDSAIRTELLRRGLNKNLRDLEVSPHIDARGTEKMGVFDVKFKMIGGNDLSSEIVVATEAALKDMQGIIVNMAKTQALAKR